VNHLRGPTASLIASLDCAGGHILVLLLLVIIGCVSGYFRIAGADRIALGSESVLLYLLGGKLAARQGGRDDA
jgi:hypothetical protein